MAGEPGGVKGARRPTRIQSVSRATRILLLAAREANGCGATQVAAELGVSLPTAYHLLNTLLAEGFLAKDASRRYRLGPQIGELADAFLHLLKPPEYLLGALHELAESSGETAYLSGWRSGEIVVLASVEGGQSVRVAGIHLGSAGYAHARASGKLLLALAPEDVRERYLAAARFEPLTSRTIVSRSEFAAELELVQQRGYASEEGEFREDVACISGPVRANDAVIAALTLSAPRERFQRNHETLLSTLLRTCAQASTANAHTTTAQ